MVYHSKPYGDYYGLFHGILMVDLMVYEQYLNGTENGLWKMTQLFSTTMDNYGVVDFKIITILQLLWIYNPLPNDRYFSDIIIGQIYS